MPSFYIKIDYRGFVEGANDTEHIAEVLDNNLNWVKKVTVKLLEED